jgi:hypothetical protein
MRLAPILATLLLVAACSSPAKVHIDPFFALPLAAAAEKETPPSVPTDASGYRISVRILRANDRSSALDAPSVDVSAGARAMITLTSQCSYVRTFVLETAPDAWTAEPVIGTVKEGLALELVTRPGAEAGQVVLAWHARLADFCGPFPTRNVLLGDGTSSGTVQLPTLNRVEATGRTVVRLGEETRLGRMPAWQEDGAPTMLTLTARVEAIAVPSAPSPGPDDPNAIDPILTRTDSPPRGAGPIEISVVWLKRDPGAATLHLTHAVAERLLSSLHMRRHKTFVVDAAAEVGTRVACVLERTYVGDYDIQVSSDTHLVEPVLKDLCVGFEACVDNRDGKSALAWSLTSLESLNTFSTSLGHFRTPVSIDIPEISEARGRLPIRSPVNLATVSPLESGGVIAVLVRKVESTTR